jgi:hypothetical protein
MKRVMIVVFSTLLLTLPITGMAGEKAKSKLCTAKDVQHNIDLLRASVEEMQATHDSQRGMDMLHEHMAMIIDNQEITLGLLEQARTGSKQNSVACPKKRDHIKK